MFLFYWAKITSIPTYHISSEGQLHMSESGSVAGCLSSVGVGCCWRSNSSIVILPDLTPISMLLMRAAVQFWRMMLRNLAGTVVFARRLLGVPLDSTRLLRDEMSTRSQMVFLFFSWSSFSARTRIWLIVDILLLSCVVLRALGEIPFIHFIKSISILSNHNKFSQPKKNVIQVYTTHGRIR